MLYFSKILFLKVTLLCCWNYSWFPTGGKTPPTGCKSDNICNAAAVWLSSESRAHSSNICALSTLHIAMAAYALLVMLCYSIVLWYAQWVIWSKNVFVEASKETGLKISTLFRNKWVMLDEMFQGNASKFAMPLENENLRIVFRF